MGNRRFQADSSKSMLRSLRRDRRASRAGFLWPGLSVVFALTLLSLPQLAAACAVCGFGREENRVAFLVTTVFLSLVPVLSIGAVVFWIWRQARAHSDSVSSLQANSIARASLPESIAE